MMVTTFLSLLLTLISAQSPLSGCRGILDPDERLACYDAAAGAVDGDTRASFRRGQWLVAFSVDPDTQTGIVGLAVEADRDSGEARPPTLLFRCTGGTLSALIDWHTPIRRDGDEAEVTIQIDSQRAEATDWRVSADGTATYPAEGQEDAFFGSLYFARRLVAGVTPDGAPSRSAGFNVSDLLGVAPSLWESCPPR